MRKISLWSLAVAALFIPLAGLAADFSDEFIDGWAYFENLAAAAIAAPEPELCEYGVDHQGSPCWCGVVIYDGEFEDECENLFGGDEEFLAEFGAHFDANMWDFSKELPVVETRGTCGCPCQDPTYHGLHPCHREGHWSCIGNDADHTGTPAACGYAGHVECLNPGTHTTEGRCGIHKKCVENEAGHQPEGCVYAFIGGYIHFKCGNDPGPHSENAICGHSMCAVMLSPLYHVTPQSICPSHPGCRICSNCTVLICKHSFHWPWETCVKVECGNIIHWDASPCH